MKHRVSDRYYWEFNGVRIEGIVEYVGYDGIVATHHPWVRCKEPRAGDIVDLREWNEAQGHDTNGVLYSDYGVIERLGWLQDNDVHVCIGGASVFLGKGTDEKGNTRIWASISGGPFELFYQDDLEPTMELRSHRYWNFRDGWAEAHNGQDYQIERPVFKLKAHPRKYVFESEEQE